MKKITTFLFISLFASVLFSQTSTVPSAGKTQSEKTVPAFVKMQQDFDAWAKGKDLSKEENWKWYKRWEEQMAKRANADGSLPDEYEYFKAAVSVAKQKQTMTNISGSSWIPVGPFAVPGSPVASGLDSYGIGRINTIAFHPTDSSTYWVGVAQGGVWKTINGGISYIPLTDNLPILRTSDICVDPLHPDTIYISLCDFEYIGVELNTNGNKRMTHYGLGVYKTTDGGQTWNPTGLAFNQTAFDGSLIRRVFIDTANSNNIIAAGTSGIWKSSDGGTSWTKTLDSLIWDIKRNPVNKNILYASGGYVSNDQQGSACILKSTDFGNTWTLLNTGIPKTGTVQRIELAVSPSNPNYVYAICCNISSGLYAIYRTTNGGTSWTKQCTTPNILGNSGTAHGGQGTYDLAIIVNPTDQNTIYTGGTIIWGSSDGGVTMTQITDYSTIHPDQHFFAYNPLNKNYYLCNDGGVYKTNAINLALNTTTWNRISDGMQIPSYYRVNTSKNNPGFLEAGAQDNGSVYFNGTKWIFVYDGDGMDGSVDDNDTNTVIASAQFGDFAKSTDGGQTITSFTVTTETGEWTTPIVRDPNNNSILYTGFTNVFKSSNGGTTWSSISNLSGPPITAIAVCPSNSNFIYVTKRVQGTTMAGAKAWMTSNGGTNWKDITTGLPDTLYFTSVAVDDIDTNTAWVTCGGFYNGVKIFKTSNGGTSWTNISYNLPNLPVNTVMKRAGIGELYIGCDVGVYQLVNGQTSWTLFSAGLPNVIISDLEIQYASQTMYASTFGRGIWSIDLGNATSVKENPMNNAIVQITPSPNSGEFQLNVKGMNAEKGSFEIIDIQGRKVFSEAIQFRSGNFTGNYALSLNYGLYFGKVSVGNGISCVLRFVVK